MSTRIPVLDERYGRTPARRRRGRVRAAVIGGLVLVAAIVWSIWTGVGGTTTALQVQTLGLTVVDDQTTSVQWLVTGRPTTTLVCAIEATDSSDAVVGLVEVVVPPDGRMNRTGSTRVTTVRRAANGLIDSCRDA